MNELDRREDPNIDEDIPGCAMVDSCSNILTGKTFTVEAEFYETKSFDTFQVINSMHS